MKFTESVLRPVKRIRGGISLPHCKNTAFCESLIMPPPKTVSIPLVQNIGAPCSPTVSVGDKVFVGTLIGDSENFISAPVHSSVSGTVKEISDKKINGNLVNIVVIESDGEMAKDPGLSPFKVRSKKDVADAARASGLVGLGGAGFPTHVKLKFQKETTIDTLIINAAECEPYITADNREAIENFDDIINGVYLLKDILGIEQVIIGVESNKPTAIEKLIEVASSVNDTDDSVKVMKLPSNYPQGAEKVLIRSATGRVLPLGKLPSDVGCIVLNITSVGVLYRFIKTGMPLVSKRITLDGTAVSEPKNIVVPIGTALKDVLEFAGVNTEEISSIIAGGPMMGSSVISEDFVIEKRTNAILLMKEEKTAPATPCIRCGRCVRACPMHLYPASVEAALNSGLKDRFENLNVNYCMECGSCSYVCPAKRPLTQVMRVAKGELRRRKI